MRDDLATNLGIQRNEDGDVPLPGTGQLVQQLGEEHKA